MENKLTKKFWFALVIFGLIGQVAWVVENMYFNVFMYEEFNASADQIATMVSLSAVTATITTLIMGVLSDKIGKRKAFMCIGYILWGLSIMAFALLKVENLTQFTDEASAVSLGISLVIIFDCIMTFFGSTANDACFNAWVTDKTDESNRGKVEGINSTMPLISILVVFGSFMFVSGDSKWTIIFISIGAFVIIAGILGLFLIEDSNINKNEGNYFSNIIYGFRPSVIKKNATLYIALIAFCIFSIALQVFMPYLIIYYEHGLKMTNYVLIMAPAIILAAIFTVFFGKFIDKNGFKKAVVVALLIFMAGLLILYLFDNTILVFIGSLLMMMGNLAGGASFSSIVRNKTPEKEVGMFQGIRMVACVLIPMVVGPFIGSSVIEGGDTIVNGDGTISQIPNSGIFLASLLVTLLLFVVFIFLFKQIKPRRIHLDSKYEVNKDTPLPEYPRPQLVRDSYLNLNGYWDFEISKTPTIPQNYSHKILVPFPMESKLSGVFKNLKKGEYIIYRKSITFEEGFIKDKVLLHFGAIDQFATIYFNGEKLIDNKYIGYFPITLDITKHLKDDNELIVICKDDNDRNYPYGKQTKESKGMWYTKVSGIWQTVWCESVSNDYIKSVRIEVDYDNKLVDVFTEQDTTTNKKVTFSLRGKEIISYTGTTTFSELYLEDFEEWTPENPVLYDVQIETEHDLVRTYFAMRKVDVQEVNGIKRLCLNNKPYFFNGLLDQGYYSDGIFTPASYEAFKDDILTMKSLGYNTLRKHIKIEPLIWYHMCDKYGMIVWQDMMNTGDYSFIRDTALPTVGFTYKSDKNLHKGPSRDNYYDAMDKTVKLLYNSPSVCLYTIFNEAWGQFDTARVHTYLLSLDKTRLIDANSGWFDMHVGTMNSKHIYFKKINLEFDDRAMIISEFGGYSCKLPDHSFNLDDTYGYRFFTDLQEFEDAFVKLYEDEVIPYIEKGLCATIYTQVSDVEEETNGILTYDRKVCKLNVERIKALMNKVNNSIK